MNFQIFRKVLALPLSTTENSIMYVLAYHVPKEGNSCFPCYKTISKHSGASNKTISKCIRVLRYAKVINFKNRADISEGKKSNEYTFILDKEIGFYRDKLTKANYERFKKDIKACREKVKQEMESEAIEAKRIKFSLPIPSHNDVPDTVTNGRIHKSQNVNNDVRDTQELEGSTIPSHLSPLPSQISRRSIRENVQLAGSNTQDVLTKEPCKKKKTVWHEEKMNLFETNHQDSSNDSVKPKDPSQQSREEWLADLNSGNTSSC